MKTTPPFQNDARPKFQYFVTRRMDDGWWRADYIPPIETTPAERMTHAEAHRAGYSKPEFSPFGEGASEMEAIALLATRLARKDNGST